MPSSIITASALGFSWPDGTPAISGLDLLVGPGRSGLVGTNGAGKSTLLRLVAGELQPTAGHLSVAGEVGYLPQDLTLDVDQPVEEFLGIGAVRRAIRAVESGDATRHTSTPSATPGTSRNGPRPSWPDSGYLPTCWTAASASSPGARSPSSVSHGCCCADPTYSSSTSRPTTSTSRRRPGCTTSSKGGAGHCSWSATTGSCSSGWTGSATCATAGCAGTAAATRRTPPRSRPSRRPPSMR